MHIPDGFVSPAVAVAGAAVAVAGLSVCVRRAGRGATERQLPLAGLAAACFLVLGAPVIPIAVGTEGHLLGGTLAVALLGLRRLLPRGSMGIAVAAGVAAAVSVLAAAVLFTAEYAVGGAAGLSLRTVAVSTIGMYALVAVVEGVVTALVVRGLLAVRADLVPVAQR